MFLLIRNPRLASLITHISSESLNVPAIETTMDCEAAITAVKTKQMSGVVSILMLNFLTSLINPGAKY